MTSHSEKANAQSPAASGEDEGPGNVPYPKPSDFPPLTQSKYASLAKNEFDWKDYQNVLVRMQKVAEDSKLSKSDRARALFVTFCNHANSITSDKDFKIEEFYTLIDPIWLGKKIDGDDIDLSVKSLAKLRDTAKVVFESKNTLPLMHLF